MKAITISLMILYSASLLFAQQTKYVTHNTMMKIKAKKFGEPVEWENKNVTVNFDYKTGEFITYLTNTDFVNPNADMRMIKEAEVQRRQVTLGGMLPISEIIAQQQETQNYKVELQLIAEELDISHTILFDMLITKPKSGESKSNRFFTLNGILYNDQTNLPAFEGYENEIQIWLMFSGFMNVQ
jgi:hypothetical protein